MIVLRVSAGLANAMYEFAAGYALSKTLNEPLKLDISAYVYSAWTFQLDRFNIPNVDKIIYRFPDPEDISHTSSTNIPHEILGDTGQAYSDCNSSLPHYKGLEHTNLLKGKPIILCGYFFPREQYYHASNAAYWSELRAIFTPRETNAVLEHFKELAEGYDTVGVHIRRGDFLVADFAWIPTANYFRAAISWFRNRLDKPRFFIFSDDINYARNILGLDSSFFYVHPLGHDIGSFSEFLCLTHCKHKIVSNDSTFSRLACELNEGKDQIIIHRKRDLPSVSWREKAINWFQKNRKRHSKLYRNNFSRDIWMEKKQETIWSKKFATNNQNSINNYAVRLSNVLICEDDTMAVNIATELTMNVAELSNSDKNRLAWRKFIAHFRLGQIDDALDLAYEFWNIFDDSIEFHSIYSSLLKDGGYIEESYVELSRCECTDIAKKTSDLLSDFTSCNRQNFFVLPCSRLSASSLPGNGLTSLGITLRRLGHKVNFLYRVRMNDNFDSQENFYIENNPQLTTRASVCLGCSQNCREDVEKHLGLNNYLKKLTTISPLGVVVTDDEFSRELALSFGLYVVYVGEGGDSIEDNLLNIVNHQSIGYKVQNERWSARQNHRLNKMDIHNAACICRWLGKNNRSLM